MKDHYNVNYPLPNKDQILLGNEEGDLNQSLEDAAYHALGIMVAHWNKKTYDEASYSVVCQKKEP